MNECVCCGRLTEIAGGVCVRCVQKHGARASELVGCDWMEGTAWRSAYSAIGEEERRRASTAIAPTTGQAAAIAQDVTALAARIWNYGTNDSPVVQCPDCSVLVGLNMGHCCGNNGYVSGDATRLAVEAAGKRADSYPEEYFERLAARTLGIALNNARHHDPVGVALGVPASAEGPLDVARRLGAEQLEAIAGIALNDAAKDECVAVRLGPLVVDTEASLAGMRVLKSRSDIDVLDDPKHLAKAIFETDPDVLAWLAKGAEPGPRAEELRRIALDKAWADEKNVWRKAAFARAEAIEVARWR